MPKQLNKKQIVAYLKYHIKKSTEDYKRIEEEKEFVNAIEWAWRKGLAGNLELLLDHIKLGKFDAKAD